MNRNHSPGRVTIVYAVLAAVSIAVLFPLLWLVATAFKAPSEEVFGPVWTWLPERPTGENFQRVWQAYPFGR